MENYIVINGKRAELTEEQLVKLGIKIKKKTPFTRTIGEMYYFAAAGETLVGTTNDTVAYVDNSLYNSANYFNDEDFAKQVALHQLLYRKLLKYAYENDAIVNDWTDLSEKYFISKSIDTNTFYVDWNLVVKHGCVVYFAHKEVAERAIAYVVKPFMKEHPEFIW